MARVKRGNVSRKRHKKVLKLAKGFRGSLSKLYRPAHQAVLHALSNQTRDRKRRKRDFRRLWIARINAALTPFSTSYSTFISSLKKKEIELNRKSLSEIAIRRPDVFSDVVQFTKS